MQVLSSSPGCRPRSRSTAGPTFERRKRGVSWSGERKQWVCEARTSPARSLGVRAHHNGGYLEGAGSPCPELPGPERNAAFAWLPWRASQRQRVVPRGSAVCRVIGCVGILFVQCGPGATFFGRFAWRERPRCNRNGGEPAAHRRSAREYVECRNEFGHKCSSGTACVLGAKFRASDSSR